MLFGRFVVGLCGFEFLVEIAHGFVFAGIVIWISRSLLDFFCATAFIFPFYADELITLVVRIKDRDRLTKPHRKHLYQLFANEKGIAHWKVSAGYGLIQYNLEKNLFPKANFSFFRK